MIRYQIFNRVTCTWRWIVTSLARWAATPRAVMVATCVASGVGLAGGLAILPPAHPIPSHSESPSHAGNSDNRGPVFVPGYGGGGRDIPGIGGGYGFAVWPSAANAGGWAAGDTGDSAGGSLPVGGTVGDVAPQPAPSPAPEPPAYLILLPALIGLLLVLSTFGRKR